MAMAWGLQKAQRRISPPLDEFQFLLCGFLMRDYIPCRNDEGG